MNTNNCKRPYPSSSQSARGSQNRGNQHANASFSTHRALPILSTSGGRHTRSTHAAAELMFASPNTIALKVDDIKEALQPLSLNVDDLLNRSDEGRIFPGKERFPTRQPNTTTTVNRDITKTRIDPANLSRSRYNDSFVDTTYGITPLTIGAVVNHYNHKYNIDIRSANLESEVPEEKARELGVNIGCLFAAQNDRRSMGVSLSLGRYGPVEDHRISIALYKPEPTKLAIVVHDPIPGCYQDDDHEGSVNEVFAGIDSILRSYIPQLSTLILDATDRNLQCDDNVCTTISMVVLKELLMNEGRAIQDMTNNSMGMGVVVGATNKTTVGLPPSIARIAQNPNKVLPQERLSSYRENKYRTVQEKLDRFNAPNGQVQFVVSSSEFPTNWSEDDIARSVAAKGYNPCPEPYQNYYGKVQTDPQNAYLRAKSLAYAMLAIDTVSQGNDPKGRLQSMFDRIDLSGGGSGITYYPPSSGGGGASSSGGGGASSGSGGASSSSGTTPPSSEVPSNPPQGRQKKYTTERRGWFGL